jgi:hypothetical protein
MDAIPLWAWAIAPWPTVLVLAAWALRRWQDRRDCDATARQWALQRKERQDRAQDVDERYRAAVLIARLRMTEIGHAETGHEYHAATRQQRAA